jgi:Glyoxalase-like domain
MDHLVFAVPDLVQGIELVEQLTGVRAELGGQHPGRGTHNALLSLGRRQYLEIIATDPRQAAPQELLFPELAGLRTPRLIAWAVAVASLADTARRAKAANIASVGPLAGARARADGAMLTWQTLRVSSAAIAGLPFFIEWGDGAVHPSQTAPSGCELVSLVIEHSTVEDTRRALMSLGVEAVVRPGPHFALKARLKTPKGDVDLT